MSRRAAPGSRRARAPREWKRSPDRRCERWRARCGRPASPERRWCRAQRRWSRLAAGCVGRFLGLRPQDDGDAFVEALAARLGRDVAVVLQREVHDAALDRRHRGKELLVAVAADLIGQLTGSLPQLRHAALFELFAIELDVFVDLAAGERLVREHLQRVEQLAALVGESRRIGPIQPDVNALLILGRSNDNAQFRERDHLLAPGVHHRGALRLLFLSRRFDSEAGEVARLHVAVATIAATATSAASTAARIAIAIAAAASAASSPTPSPAAVARLTMFARRSR